MWISQSGLTGSSCFQDVCEYDCFRLQTFTCSCRFTCEQKAEQQSTAHLHKHTQTDSYWSELLTGSSMWMCWCYLWSPVSLSPADLLVTSSPTVCNWWWRAACEHLLPSYQTLIARLVINCLVSSFLTELLWTCSLTVCVNFSWLGFTCQADYWSLLTP